MLIANEINNLSGMRNSTQDLSQYSFIDFERSYQIALLFAEHIEASFESLAKILTTYESFEVVRDETARTLDLLRSLNENNEYFKLRIGAVTSFLPRNQPLYALTCFVIIPSLMASEVHFRIPQGMRYFFPELIQILKIHDFFPNIHVSKKERAQFLIERTALCINTKTQENQPVTDVVIFTGTPFHADRLRTVFDQRTLFITNGAGHNPLIITEHADISNSVEAALTLQLYNQGQDCASPNSILVHNRSFLVFNNLLLEKLRRIKIGNYNDRSCIVGPINDIEDLIRIQGLLVENKKWINSNTPGVIRTNQSIVEPTIINKPLRDGGNYNEVFAPIFFIQEYENDVMLSNYFENDQYARNAMYVTVYGDSKYIDSLAGKYVNDKLLHDESTIIRNTHLHAHGIERGTQPYGGYGHGASSVSINRKITCKPTLPQREIYDYIVRPILELGNLENLRKSRNGMQKIMTKNIEKLLGQKNSVKKDAPILLAKMYIDLLELTDKGKRYSEISSRMIHSLLTEPNIEYMSDMELKHIDQIRELHNFLKKNRFSKVEELESILYSIPKRFGATERENRIEQLALYRQIYYLLFGKDSGPRLAQFLFEANHDHILLLLDI